MFGFYNEICRLPLKKTFFADLVFVLNLFLDLNSNWKQKRKRKKRHLIQLKWKFKFENKKAFKIKVFKILD